MAGDIFNLFNLDTIFVPPHLTFLTYILYIEQLYCECHGLTSLPFKNVQYKPYYDSYILLYFAIKCMLRIRLTFYEARVICIVPY